ncbi:fucose permease [Kineococcus rhizosphaerae]|uniref:Fucose permease n=1 Tax=Kineococcus rhizosphaerae TaxID=559628 RepID=A0A2T0R3R1_9ACTN|nr:MFS transporter [Kineococcus rhizosphaerae]PRY14686.1 fucose permease [Kineococcus rhizosphaerae]
MTPTPFRVRAALTTAFACTGLTMATWVSRTPAIRDLTHSSTAQMGLVIAGLSAGSMVGIAVGGTYVARTGARSVVRTGMLAIALGSVVVAAGAGLGHAPLVALGLAFLGFGMGSGEIALNVEGVALESVVGRTVVPSLHGAYSAGLCAGALLGLAANATHLPVPVHLLAVAGLTAGATGWLVRNLATGTGREQQRRTRVPLRETVTGFLSVWRERRTLAIGVVVLGMALAEGSAGDWLPLIVVDGFGLTATTGSLVYAFFGAAMATGRFAGGPLLDRYGRAPVLLTSAGAAVVGIALVSFAPGIALAVVGVLLWGLGAALGFPVALSAAGDDPVGAARRVSAVATMGYLAFLVGPPVLGFVGEHVGLRGAILLVLVVVTVSGSFSRAVAKPSPQPTREAV